MKKLMIGLLALGSISAFANVQTVNIVNNSVAEKINLEVVADKIVESDFLDTITYFNIRLESENDTFYFEGSNRTLGNICEKLGHNEHVGNLLQTVFRSAVIAVGEGGYTGIIPAETATKIRDLSCSK